MQRRSATLEDVAREAGVSQQTVSRVVNNPQIVAQRTREKVLRAMQTLHYVPNRSAQLLAGKAAASIGLITASLTLHAPSQIAAAVKRYAGEQGLEVAIAMPAHSDYPALQARLDEFRAQHIRGAVISLPLESSVAERLAAEKYGYRLPVSRCLAGNGCLLRAFLIIVMAAAPACVTFGELGASRVWPVGRAGKLGIGADAPWQLARDAAPAGGQSIDYGVRRLERRQRLAKKPLSCCIKTRN